jgi:phytoene dehydrogenase-like protein
MGPWSAGTAAVLLAGSAGNDGGAPGSPIARGPGALAEALASAASGFGAEIRTASEVVQVTIERHRATGVALADGSEISARAVVTAMGPKRTLTTLVDPVEIGPHLRWRATNIRTPGSDSKVNLALSACRVRRRRARAARRPHRDRALDRPPRAGVRRLEVRAGE